MRIIALVTLLISANVNANVVGTDAQNFNAITSGLDFVTVHSSETLEPGIFNVGFFLNLGVNTLPIFEDSQGNHIKFKDEILGADINVGYGLKENWDVGISFPQIWYQKIEDSNVYRGFYEGYGNTEIRLNTKYRFFGDQDHGLASILSVNFDRIKNNPYTGIDAGPTVNLEFAYDKKINGVAYGVNAGYRFRSPGTPSASVPINPVANQWIGSLAASYLMTKYDAKLIAEIFGSFPAVNNNKEDYRAHSSLEALLGVKYDHTRNLAVHFGGGSAIQHGTATPDWRVYSGINYAFGEIQKTVDVPVAKKFQTQDRVVLDINFEFDSDRIKDQISYDTLNELAEYVMAVGKYKLMISGHTDSVGSENYNLDLSKRRANSVKKYLLTKFPKIKDENLVAQGFGESMPIADNGNYQGRQKNRRVEFKIEKP